MKKTIKNTSKIVQELRKLDKTYYQGTVGTFKIKSADVKKTYISKNLGDTLFVMNAKKFPKGDYYVEITTNKNIKKTPKKSFNLTFDLEYK